MVSAEIWQPLLFQLNLASTLASQGMFNYMQFLFLACFPFTPLYIKQANKYIKHDVSVKKKTSTNCIICIFSQFLLLLIFSRGSNFSCPVSILFLILLFSECHQSFEALQDECSASGVECTKYQLGQIQLLKLIYFSIHQV